MFLAHSVDSLVSLLEIIIRSMAGGPIVTLQVAFNLLCWRWGLAGEEEMGAG